MELLTDNITPSLEEYQKQLQNYSQMGGTSMRQRANDWATMYYQNAYNLYMQNYMNQYNSPKEQMARYIEAGLNPFLVQADAGNMSSAPSGAAPRGSQDHGVQDFQAALQSLDTVNDSLKTASEIYDYIKYGRSLSEYQKEEAYWDMLYSQNRNYRESIEADWALYWNTGISKYPSIEGSPRARYMEESTSLKSQQIEQLKALVDVLYPSQAAANDARAALTVFQEAVARGEDGAILEINTGNEVADSILKSVVFWIKNSVKVGLSKKF